MRPKLEYLNPSELVPYERNARTHSDEQIEQIDEELLRIELSELEDFDIDILGFSLDELDALVYSLDTLDEGAFHHPSEESEETFIDPPSSPVSRPGDVWELGPHRLLCGDSTKP